MSITLTQVGFDYLNALRYEHGRSANTLDTYGAWFHHFQRWLKAAGLPDSLSSFAPAVCRTYLYSLQKRGLRPRTILSAFHPLRGLARYAVAQNLLTESPLANLAMPKKDAARRSLVSDQEVVALLQATALFHPERKSAMAGAMLSTLIFGGMRFREWLDIRVGDVSLETASLLIAHGKGEKSRTLYPPEECMDALRAWFALRGECCHDFLWATTPGRRMGEVGVRDLLEEVKAIAGLAGRENIKPHSLRHAFATRMMNNGAPIKTIQAAMGHSSLLVTQAYLHLNEGEARKMSKFANLRPPESAPPPQNVAPPPAPPQSPKNQRTAQFVRQRREAARR